jgi:hypothetical protein
MELQNTKLLSPDSSSKEEMKIYKLYDMLQSLDIPVKLIKNYHYRYLYNGKVESKIVDMVVIESNEDNKYPKYGFIFDQYTNRVIQVIGNKK